MAILQLSVFAENTQGALIHITKLLADAGVDIRALSLADTKEYGILRLIVSDHAEASKVLSDDGYLVRTSPVVGVAMSDEVGALHHILYTLDQNNINIEYMYAFISRSSEKACLILRTEQSEAAEQALLKSGAVLLCAEDVETHLG